MRERNYTFRTRSAGLARMARSGAPEGMCSGAGEAPERHTRQAQCTLKLHGSRSGFSRHVPKHFLCNVSLRGRRAHRALIYDVRALRLGIGPRRAESPYAAIPSV